MSAASSNGGGLGIAPLDEPNRVLLENVHPPTWVNPKPAGRYNMVVVGAGTAGLVTAIGSAGLGAKVALIERHLMGGDCLNVGCVPSKALIRAARAFADVRDAGVFGVRVPPGASLDFGEVMARMRTLRARISRNDSARRYQAEGVDVFIGQGTFSGRNSVRVDGPAGEAELTFSKACVATGTRAVVPPIPGLKEAGYLTNETVFNLTELPGRLVVIGAGPIGCELAQSFARFGAEVHLVEVDLVMNREDREAVELVEKRLREEGVRIYTLAKVAQVEVRAGEKTVLVEQKGQSPVRIACDAILVGAGRAPNLEGLGLEKAGVRFDPREGVSVDDCLLTTNPDVYAAGDVCSRYKFTHAADFLARTVIENALFKSGVLSFLGRRRVSRLIIPWCTYTDPEVAHVGAYEKDLEKAGIPHRVFVQRFEEVDRALLDGEEQGFAKVVVARPGDRILGATIVARHAGEMISELTQAMVQGIGLKAIAGVIHPYPTQGEAIRRAGDACRRADLTPRARAFTGWLMARRR